MSDDQVHQQILEEEEQGVASRKGVPQGKKKQDLTRFGEYIDTLHSIFEVTHQRIARQAGLDPSSLSMIIHGVNQPERSTVQAIWQGLCEIAVERDMGELMTPVLEEGFFNSVFHVAEHQYETSDVLLQALKGRVDLIEKIKEQKRIVHHRDLTIHDLREENKDLRAENIQLRKQLRP